MMYAGLRVLGLSGPRRLRRRRLLLKALLALRFTCVDAQAQATAGSPPVGAALEEEVRVLREEVAALRTEVRSLQSELKGKSGPAAASALSSEPAATSALSSEPAATSALSSEPAAPAPSTGGFLQSQLEQLAQTKVESNSRLPVKLYGTILSTTFFNTRAVNWLDQPTQATGGGTGSFSSSLRQSRLGLLVDGPKIGPFTASGVFALDFNGGSNDFQSSPLFGLANIVYAYARFESAHTALEAGQDEMILAPRNPTSLIAFSNPELYRSGNLYLRAPQLRIEQQLGDGPQGKWKAVLGLVAPIGTYPTAEVSGQAAVSPPIWQRPAVQSRLSWQTAGAAPGEKPRFELGASGHYGRIAGTHVAASSWAGSFDIDANFHRWGATAEGYAGKNLGVFGGGVAQPGRALGGFAEARFQATSRLRFNSGAGTDHLAKAYFAPVPLRANSALFANTIFQFTPEVSASFEYRFLFTKPSPGALLNNNNLNFGVAYSF